MGRRGWASGLFGWRRRTPGGQSAPVTPRLTTFGDFTHEELAGLTGDADIRPLVGHEQVKGVLDGLYDRITADSHYMRATRRWNEDAPDPLEFVPGDVLVLRLLAARPSIQEALLLHAALQDGKWPQGGEEMLDWRLRHDTSVASWLLDAVPYFLRQPSARARHAGRAAAAIPGRDGLLRRRPGVRPGVSALVRGVG